MTSIRPSNRNRNRTREAARRRTRPSSHRLRSPWRRTRRRGSRVGSRVGASDTTLLEYARDTDRTILSEDTDFRGADPALDVESHPGVLTCDTAAPPGEIAAAIRRIDALSTDTDGTVLFVPGEWV